MLETNISKGPHDSAFTLEMNYFVQGEIHWRIKDGFSILLPDADAIRLLGEKQNI